LLWIDRVLECKPEIVRSNHPPHRQRIPWRDHVPDHSLEVVSGHLDCADWNWLLAFLRAGIETSIGGQKQNINHERGNSLISTRLMAARNKLPDRRTQTE
jgi:hypothetical protein